MDKSGIKNLEELLAQSSEYAVGCKVFDPQPLRWGMSLIRNHSYQILRKVSDFSGVEAQEEGGCNHYDEKGSYSFLNEAGVNMDKISDCIKKLDRIPSEEIKHEDKTHQGVDSFLQSRNQKALDTIITRSRVRTIKQYNSFFNSMLLLSWEKMKHELVGTYSRVSGLSQDFFDQGLKQQTKSEVDIYRLRSNESVLNELNSQLLVGEEFDVMLKFFVGQGPYSEVSIDPKIRLCWVILDRLLNPCENRKSDVETPLRKGLYLGVNLKTAENGNAAQTRQLIAQRARGWLEESYLSRIISLVTNIRMDIGGLASIDKQIYAYLKQMMTRGGSWADNLEVHGNDPIWAHLFICLRSGRKDEALKYLYSKESVFRKSSEAFYEYFVTFIETGRYNNRGRIHDSLLREWNTLKKHMGMSGTDPFKYIIFKIVGRFDPNSKIASNPQYMSTIEDYTWLMLCFVDETQDQNPNCDEAFGLRDAASKLMHMPINYFDNVIEHFRILLLCGEIELAIAYLYDTKEYEVEAAHFAIAMAYIGIVSQPPAPKVLSTSTVEGPQITLYSGNKYTPVYLNYTKLISNCALTSMTFDSNLALNYAYTLGIVGTTLNSDDTKPTSVYPEVACTIEAIEIIKKIIVSSNNPDEIVGFLCSDGSVRHGPLKKYSALIHVTTDEQYNTHIIAGAAELAQGSGNYNLAINLLNVSKRYSLVIKMLNGLLSEYILYYEHPEHLKCKNVVDLEALSTPVIQMFERCPEIYASVDENLIKACVTLKKLYLFARLTRQNQYEEALSVLKEVSIFPFSKGVCDSAEESRRLCSLEDVSSVVSTIVRMAIVAMTALLQDIRAPESDQLALRLKLNRLTDIKEMTNAMIHLAGGTTSMFPQDVLTSLSEFMSQID